MSKVVPNKRERAVRNMANYQGTYRSTGGVDRKDKVLLGEVDAVLARESPAIARILESYGVPIATPVQQTVSSTRAETPS